jgi:transposase
MSKEKLNKEAIKDAVRLTKTGLLDSDIAAYLGVHPSTFSRWINHPATENQRQLCKALKKAEVERKGALLGRILRASDETWQAAAWVLERRYPAEFAKPVRPVEDTHLAKADQNIKSFIDALGLR